MIKLFISARNCYLCSKIIPMLENKLFFVDNIIVNREISDTFFCCDLSKCKGACCTLESEFGAPLRKEEIEKIAEMIPEVLEYLSPDHQEAIKKGFFEFKYEEYLVKSINNKACVFAFFEDGIAKCALERGYFEKKTNFRKPISCHLFPIRVSSFGTDVLRYERFSECSPALENGKHLKTTIMDFCKDALIRIYGIEWYNKMKSIFGK